MDPRDNFYALKRSTLIACIMMCSPGMPMLLQGKTLTLSGAMGAVHTLRCRRVLIIVLPVPLCPCVRPAGQEFVELASPEWPEGPELDWTNRIRMDGIFRSVRTRQALLVW